MAAGHDRGLSQCGLAHLRVAEPLALSQALDAALEPGLRIVASLEAGSRPLAEVVTAHPQVATIEVAVGPEGDFSLGEYRLLKEAGFQAVRLGANVLRAETAAAYILSVVDQLSAGSSGSDSRVP